MIIILDQGHLGEEKRLESCREQRDQCFADPGDVKVILESEIT